MTLGRLSFNGVSALTLVEFFEQLSACPREGAGAWVFEHGATQLGVLFIDNGLICWSTLPGRRGRLLDILEAVSGTHRLSLEETLRACVASKVSITEGLARAGVVTAEQLVTALRRDTLESLLQIASTPERRGIWRPHRGEGYGAAIRFSLTELLVEAAADSVEAPRLELTASAERLFGAKAHVLFVSPQGLPVAASASVAALSVPECLELARRADDLAASTSSNIYAGNGSTGPGAVTVVWRDGPWLGVLETRGAPHAVLRKLIARNDAR